MEYRMSLTVWNDSVALLLSSREADPGSTSFEICVMDEYRDILKDATPLDQASGC